MFTSIVTGTDGSLDAEAGLRQAAMLARANPGAAVHVVTAYHPLSLQELNEIKNILPDEYRDVIHSHYGAESILDRARKIFKAAGVDAEYHEVNNDPTDAILDAAEKCNADLIVVGSRGENAAKRLVHGSVSTKVLHHAPCSVLVVKNPA